jgi:hypothetical protein
MKQADDRGNPRRHLILALVTALGLIALAAGPVQADLTMTPFILLIQDGLDFPFQTTDLNGLAVLARRDTPVYEVVNGAKGPQFGTATVLVWARSVADPFFDHIGPIAALVVLNVGGDVIGRLGLIQTPTQFLTTLGLQINGGVESTFAGSWVFGAGTLVAGGTAKDLAIGGVLVSGGSGVIHVAHLDLEVDPHFGSGGTTPTDTPNCASLECTNKTGSFYGQTVLNGAARPIRTYSAVLGAPLGFYANLGVIEAAGNSYIVVACSGATPSAQGDVSGCNVSVPGSAVAGAAAYDVPNFALTTLLSLDEYALVP